MLLVGQMLRRSPAVASCIGTLSKQLNIDYAEAPMSGVRPTRTLMIEPQNL